jgi:hypothetical protein
MKVADKIVAWLLTVAPLAHLALTPRQFTPSAIWWVAGGLLMILAGILNLLRIRYAAIAPGVRLVSMITNIVMALFALAIGLAANQLLGPPGFTLVLYLAAFAFSFQSSGASSRSVASGRT